MSIEQEVQWTVLIADDEPDSIEVVTEVLEFSGATVYSAENGREALDVLKTVRPDVILTDLSMPVMDGFSLLASIRRDPELNDIPVIAMTAHAMAGDEERGLSAGFTAYLTKPISAISLVQDILQRVPSLQ